MPFRFFASLFAVSVLAIGVNSLTVRAAGDPIPGRGSRVVASVRPKAKSPKVTVVEHLRDDGNLSLVIEGADGTEIRNDQLISALDRDEEDVSSYNVSAKVDPTGAIKISSVKDWGTSNWSYGYTVSFRDGDYHLAKFEYKLESKQKHGTCSLDLASGGAVVNGRSRSFDVTGDSLANADGIELERICQQLGML